MPRRRWAFLVFGLLLGLGYALWPNDGPPPGRKDLDRKRRAAHQRDRSTARDTPFQDPEEPRSSEEAEAATDYEEPHRIWCPVESEDPISDQAEVRSPWGQPRLAGLVVDGQVMLMDPRPRGHALLSVEGLPDTPFSWDEEGCGPIRVGQFATVLGTVQNAFLRGSRRPHVVGCAANTPVDQDGQFELRIAVEPCEIVARRRDGPLLAVSDPVSIDPRPGEIIELTLDLPDYRQAGVGFSFELVAGGLEVVAVHEDTPAWDGGLRTGDTIVAVDGESTEEMRNDDIMATIPGPEGTTVQLTVLRGDEELSIRFRRESLDHALPRGKHHRKSRIERDLEGP